MKKKTSKRKTFNAPSMATNRNNAKNLRHQTKRRITQARRKHRVALQALKQQTKKLSARRRHIIGVRKRLQKTALNAFIKIARAEANQTSRLKIKRAVEMAKVENAQKRINKLKTMLRF